MCTYNGERLVQDQLDSILAQTRRPDEMIVCDDGSRDGTVEVLREFADRSPFPVKVIVNTENLGATRNYQQAIGQCSGDLIAFADQDDVWLPRKLEKMEIMFADKPALGAVFSDANVVDESLRPLGYTLWKSLRFNTRERCLARNGKSLDPLMKHNIASGATMAFNARLYGRLILPIPEGCLGDHWMALICAAIGQLGMIEEPLILYRKHPAQMIGPQGNGSLLSIIAGEARKCMAGGDYIRAFRSSRITEIGHATELYMCAYERLEKSGLLSGKPEVAKKFEEKLAHLYAREKMARAGPADRFRRIIGETTGKRYNRYSNGIAYPIGDFLA